MEAKKIQHYSDITEDMIQDWKAKYGEFALRGVEVPLDNDDEGEDNESLSEDAPVARFVLKVPNRHVMMAVEQKKAGNDLLKAEKILIENCVLGGDMAAIDQYGHVFLELIKAISQMIDSQQAIVKKI